MATGLWKGVDIYQRFPLEVPPAEAQPLVSGRTRNQESEKIKDQDPRLPGMAHSGRPCFCGFNRQAKCMRFSSTHQHERSSPARWVVLKIINRDLVGRRVLLVSLLMSGGDISFGKYVLRISILDTVGRKAPYLCSVGFSPP